MLTWDNIQSNAIAFSKRWKDGCNEEAQAQSFTTGFLQVFGVEDPVSIGDFEYKVPIGTKRVGYIDYLWKGQIAIEMKSRGNDLTAAFEQLRNYMSHLPEEEIPDLWLVFAGDTGIFPQDSLYNYIEKSESDGSDLSDRINKLFEILDMPPDTRAKRTLLSDELKQFRHINGKLFKDHLW